MSDSSNPGTPYSALHTAPHSPHCVQQTTVNKPITNQDEEFIPSTVSEYEQPEVTPYHTMSGKLQTLQRQCS